MSTRPFLKTIQIIFPMPLSNIFEIIFLMFPWGLALIVEKNWEVKITWIKKARYTSIWEKKSNATNPYQWFTWLFDKQGVAWRSEGNVAMIALPLGMSAATLITLVWDLHFLLLYFWLGNLGLVVKFFILMRGPPTPCGGRWWQKKSIDESQRREKVMDKGFESYRRHPLGVTMVVSTR